MRKLIPIFFGFVLLLLIGAPSQASTSLKSKLLGSWQLKSTLINGKPVALLQGLSILFNIKKDGSLRVHQIRDHAGKHREKMSIYFWTLAGSELSLIKGMKTTRHNVKILGELLFFTEKNNQVLVFQQKSKKTKSVVVLKKANGQACNKAKDCQSGTCEGLGCQTSGGICRSQKRMCTLDFVPYCSCQNKTFLSSGSCPGQRYKHRGMCKKITSKQPTSRPISQPTSRPISQPTSRPISYPTSQPAL